MFNEFRLLYPHGCLISEFVTVNHGKYVVRALVQNDGVTLATGLAAADTVEAAEDRARLRALEILGMGEASPTPVEQKPSREVDTPEDASWRKTQSPPQVRETAEFTFPTTPIDQIPVETVETDTPMLDFPTTTSEPQSISETEPAVDKAKKQPASTKPEKATPPDEKKAQPIPSNPLAPHEDPRIEQIDQEMLRLGWSRAQGRDFLVETYGKRSRLVLTNEELQEFLEHLQKLPTP